MSRGRQKTRRHARGGFGAAVGAGARQNFFVSGMPHSVAALDKTAANGYNSKKRAGRSGSAGRCGITLLYVERAAVQRKPLRTAEKKGEKGSSLWRKNLS